MKKEFWHYMENAQENRRLEVQNEIDTPTAISLGLLGTNLVGLLYTASALYQNKDFKAVTVADMWQTLKELFGGDTKYEKEYKATLLKIFSGKTELLRREIEKDLKTKATDPEVMKKINKINNDPETKEIIKNKSENSLIEKIKTFYKGKSSNSK